MKKVILLPIMAAAFALSGCATSGYDGCHGVGCTVDNPDRFRAANDTPQGMMAHDATSGTHTR